MHELLVLMTLAASINFIIYFCTLDPNFCLEENLVHAVLPIPVGPLDIFIYISISTIYYY